MKQRLNGNIRWANIALAFGISVLASKLGDILHLQTAVGTILLSLRRRSLQAPPALYATALFLDSTEPYFC